MLGGSGIPIICNSGTESFLMRAATRKLTGKALTGKALTDKALPDNLPAWGVLALESHHSPAFTMEWRTHSFLKIVYVLHGNGIFHFGKRSQLFSAGDVVIVPPETANRIEDDPASASSLYVCCLATELLDFDPSIIKQFRIRCVRGDGHFANRVASLMRRMVHLQDRGNQINDGQFRSIAMVTEAMNLVQLVLQLKSRKRPPIADSNASQQSEQIADYVAGLENDFFEATTIDAAAASVGMPRRTFTKLFCEHTGESWLQYVRRLAITHATVRLRETDTPVTSIAFECGFNDLSTFYRQFKSQVGVSPAAYRAGSQRSESS